MCTLNVHNYVHFLFIYKMVYVECIYSLKNSTLNLHNCVDSFKKCILNVYNFFTLFENFVCWMYINI